MINIKEYNILENNKFLPFINKYDNSNFIFLYLEKNCSLKIWNSITNNIEKEIVFKLDDNYNFNFYYNEFINTFIYIDNYILLFSKYPKNTPMFLLDLNLEIISPIFINFQFNYFLSSYLFYNNKIIVYGGINEIGEISNKLIIIDITTLTIIEKEIDKIIKAIIFCYDDKLIVGGGFSKLENKIFNYYDKNNFKSIDLKNNFKIREVNNIINLENCFDYNIDDNKIILYHNYENNLLINIFDFENNICLNKIILDIKYKEIFFSLKFLNVENNILSIIGKGSKNLKTIYIIDIENKDNNNLNSSINKDLIDESSDEDNGLTFEQILNKEKNKS